LTSCKILFPLYIFLEFDSEVFISDDSWHVFLKRFAASVEHITGQELEVKAASGSDSSTVVEQELETLRTQVEELSDEASIDK
jgi:hypothetical protein